ncbi:MAG: chemoreceptor glutamine deamidase CheD [Sinobacteraceae bacterium]|nr:chemoreceptor glutamine deamidase CheD [Nevskiaceae bacterium]MCP5338876.1 chemoreceptor glutamine deamidase CheD [Nevskiaceae bacterium]MCP5360735.1 chemoreceptor glutamine deamidase CheD [Nevskiaceae bacterium]MCP5466209.1 chemoreceptor glutamine deamidase CheD [Nevskiaceae bacterium]MCP5471611.1 chemoreceptor glutamine deamidase CheD [Nevskiaceae bacterium]
MAAAHFSHIGRYWDARQGKWVAKLLPGDYYVATQDELIFTVLGSCVSACIRDRVLRIGGMNHFMLPENAGDGRSPWGEAASAATRYGNVAMERLINDILKLGGRRENLEVKLVGGGRVLDAMTDVGARNIRFVREFVATEGYKIVGEDLGSTWPRKVLYHPSTGDARVKKLGRDVGGALAERERSHARSIDSAPVAGEIDLF